MEKNETKYLSWKSVLKSEKYDKVNLNRESTRKCAIC